MKFNKKVISWAFYDWGNSAFATTIMAGFFPMFFKEYWSVGAEISTSTARVGIANSIAGLLVALISPFLGAIADKSSKRKAFLIFFTSLGVLSSASLYLISKGSWELAALFYVLGVAGFSGSNTFYDSLMVFVSNDKSSDMVSSLGFSLGYLGGGLLFALNVWMVLSFDTFGLSSTTQAVKLSFIMVAFWWLIFSIPLLLFVKEDKKERESSYKALFIEGFNSIKETFNEIRSYKKILYFLIAYWLYIDGVDSVIKMAVDYGMSIGFESNDLITALLITQFVGFPAALLFGIIGNKFGTERGILAAIIVYLGASVWASMMSVVQEFYLMAVLIGMVQGGIQALSRSYYSRFVPKERSAQFFGFYNLLGKFATVFGPALIGGTTYFVSALGYPDIASRIGILSVSILFLAGGFMFIKSIKLDL
ncbi:MAG: MFS transporter [Candidatus Cloacimonadota bacterium]|nr:MAG: MFS transporter [Candidatus Cloacimonadota bacterium]PIE78841.1 MAG: MFS transporter [Candidatus Delongbacteria bacterium]